MSSEGPQRSGGPAKRVDTANPAALPAAIPPAAPARHRSRTTWRAALGRRPRIRREADGPEERKRPNKTVVDARLQVLDAAGRWRRRLVSADLPGRRIACPDAPGARSVHANSQFRRPMGIGLRPCSRWLVSIGTSGPTGTPITRPHGRARTSAPSPAGSSAAGPRVRTAPGTRRRTAPPLARHIRAGTSASRRP